MTTPSMTASRRAGLIIISGISAVALSACGAGQISQTADQVAAVDGNGANASDGSIAIRNVTVIVDDHGTAGLRFTAVNQDPHLKPYSLESVSVDGNPVTLSSTPTIQPQCSVVADTDENLDLIKKSDDPCIQYVSTSVTNPGYPAGGNAKVSFTFSNTTIDVTAAVAANQEGLTR